MTQDIDMKELEKKAWKSTFQDGLHDIVFGVLLVSFGIAPILRQFIGLGYIPFVVLPAPLIFVIGKKFVTLPRIGIVRFGPKRKATHKKMVKIMVVVFILTLILLIMTITKTFPGALRTVLKGYAIPSVIGISAFIGISFCARIMDFPRMYIYAIMIGLGIPVSEVLYKAVGPPLYGLFAFGIPGVFVLSYGIILFSRFLRMYPKPAEESGQYDSI